MNRNIRLFPLIAATVLCLISGAASGARAQDDPLPSWNDGPVKRKIIAYVTAAVTPGAGFVKEQDRIATFDNDGTLWCEQPTVEAEFAASRLKAKAKNDPALRATIARVQNAVKSGKSADVQKDILDLISASHSGLTEEAFEDAVRVWLSTARHPKFNRPYTELRYQPMVELLSYLRANRFQTWICSGGTLEFIRVFSPTAYHIPRPNVIGSAVKLETRYDKDGRSVVYRAPGIAHINDKDGKPVGIALHIGQRPAFAAGNERSGGDIAMLRYSKGFYGPSLQILVNHDDAAREYAYAEKDNVSLNAAAKYGFTVISMKRDWKQVFPTMTSGTTSGGAPAALVGTNWYLTALDGKAIPSYRGTRFPFLQLTADGKAAGFAGVNRFFGMYATSGQSLKFSGVASTKMAGPPASMALETSFLQALDATDRFSITNGILELRQGETVRARLSATMPNPPTGGVLPQ